MKKIVSLVLGLLLLVSCGTARKLHKNESEVLIDSTQIVKEKGLKSEVVVDTNRTEHGKITITEIEFHTPAGADESQVDLTITEAMVADVELSNVGTVKGVVKSIKQTVIEADVESKGASRESRESSENESALNVSIVETTTDEHQEPTPDPYRWRYIFYMSLVIVAALLYLKRIPIVNWIRKILSGIVKVL